MNSDLPLPEFGEFVMNSAENILDEDDCDWYVKVWWQVRWNVGDGFSQW